MNIPLISRNLDMETIIHGLRIHGAISLPLIDETTRQTLVAEARSLPYIKQPEYLQTGVREDIATCEALDSAGPCMTLARNLENTLNKEASKQTPYPFSEPLRFSRVVLQHYATDSAGITPHRDFSHSIDLIAVLVLEGSGRFCICDDRTGANAREVPTAPGRIILMRGPGFLGTTVRPMHLVDRITSQRFVLGMRCYRSPILFPQH